MGKNDLDLGGLDLGDLDLGDLGFGDEGAATERLKTGGAKAAEEISAVLKAFSSRKADERQNFWDNTDSEYWVAVCFQTREQKEAFLRAANWIQYGDKYLDGLDVAREMKIDIRNLTPKIRKISMHKNWAELSQRPGARQELKNNNNIK